MDIDTAEPVVVNALTGTPEGAGGVSDASDWPATYVTIYMACEIKNRILIFSLAL